MRTDLPRLILASASPRRVDLLNQLKVPFEVVPSGAPETHDEQMTAQELSLLNAYRKARVIAKQFPDALVLGADTLVCLGSTLYGKPQNREDAARMLSELQGKTHQVVTGVCLMRLRAHREKLFAETSLVTFRPLTAGQILAYLISINPLDKAGAYAIQENGVEIIEDVAGSYSNVVGLPLERLTAELESW